MFQKVIIYYNHIISLQLRQVGSASVHGGSVPRCAKLCHAYGGGSHGAADRVWRRFWENAPVRSTKHGRFHIFPQLSELEMDGNG